MGRPVGKGPVATLRRELLGEGKVGPLVDKVYELAMAGDMVAARLLLDRVVPALRTQAASVKVEMPTGTLTDKALALLAAAFAGKLPSDVASELIAAIGKVAEIEQAADLRAGLDELGKFA